MNLTLQGNLVLPDSVIKNGEITIDKGIITAIKAGGNQDNTSNSETVIWEDGYIIPGLLDTHVHGNGGADIMDNSKDSFDIISSNLLKRGVTGFLATTLTSSLERLQEVVEFLAKWKKANKYSELLGIHLEGPWIHPDFIGAQNAKYYSIPRQGQGKLLFDKSAGLLKMITLAPEIKGGLEMVKELVSLGVVVSLGHTNATFEQAEQAFKLGANHSTHTFNAMRGLHHREPGVIGASLVNESVFNEVIADGFHVHPEVIKMLVKLKGTDKVILISDGMRATGMPEGTYDLGGLPIKVKDGKAETENGALAGSMLTLNKAILNMMEYGKLPIWEAVKMASLNPAKALGVEKELGSIEVGKKANLVAIDEKGNVHKVWMDGKLKYENKKTSLG